MGVDGLLKFLQPITQKEHLSTFKNHRAAIDIMSWIYRAYYVNAQALRNDKQSLAYLDFINKMLDLFQCYKIDIICVFDGRFVSKKQETLDKRKIIKENNRKKGQELLEKGEEQESKKYLNRCININERIVSTTMRLLKGRKVPFIVAPYEADSQITKLFNLSLVEFAVCQDSDLVIYGVPVVLKLSTEGDCDYLNINQASSLQIESVFVKGFVQMSKQKRTEVAVLTGTDYLPSIKGIGIKKSVKYLTQFDNIHEAIHQISKTEKFKAHMPQNYEINALKAKAIFMLATSYNTLLQKLQFLNPEYLNQLKYDEFLEQDINQIVGIDYGYDQEMSQGFKNVWNFQERDLTPILYESNSTINLSVLSQKQMNLSNSKIIKSLNQNGLNLENSDSFQQEIMMICQKKQLSLKAEKLTQMKQQWEKTFTSDLQKFQQRQKEMKEKLGDWVRYCPIQ